MPKRTGILLWLILSLMLVGCSGSYVELTEVQYETFSRRSASASLPIHEQPVMRSDRMVELSDRSAVWFRVAVPDGLTADQLKGAVLDVPITRVSVESHPELDLYATYKASHMFRAYRLSEPLPVGSSVQYRQLEELLDFARPTTTRLTAEFVLTRVVDPDESVQLNITDHVKAWLSGEPNYGILVVPDNPAVGATPGASWVYVPPYRPGEEELLLRALERMQTQGVFPAGVIATPAPRDKRHVTVYLWHR